MEAIINKSVDKYFENNRLIIYICESGERLIAEWKKEMPEGLDPLDIIELEHHIERCAGFHFGDDNFIIDKPGPVNGRTKWYAIPKRK